LELLITFLLLAIIYLFFEWKYPHLRHAKKIVLIVGAIYLVIQVGGLFQHLYLRYSAREAKALRSAVSIAEGRRELLLREKGWGDDRFLVDMRARLDHDKFMSEKTEEKKQLALYDAIDSASIKYSFIYRYLTRPHNKIYAETDEHYRKTVLEVKAAVNHIRLNDYCLARDNLAKGRKLLALYGHLADADTLALEGNMLLLEKKFSILCRDWGRPVQNEPLSDDQGNSSRPNGYIRHP
jgi:hypothetical protein